MRSPVVAIEPSATLREAAQVLREQNIGTLVILDGQEIQGILSERDVVRAVALSYDPDSYRVAEAMSRSPRYLTPVDSVHTALEVMHAAGLRHLPVIDEGEVVGIVSIRDLAGQSR